jgi:hypothetical protein
MGSADIDTKSVFDFCDLYEIYRAIAELNKCRGVCPWGCKLNSVLAANKQHEWKRSHSAWRLCDLKKTTIHMAATAAINGMSQPDTLNHVPTGQFIRLKGSKDAPSTQTTTSFYGGRRRAGFIVHRVHEPM